MNCGAGSSARIGERRAARRHATPVWLPRRGYGRRLLGWKSDLDVRLLTSAEPERIQTLAEAILYPLWDAGFSIAIKWSRSRASSTTLCATPTPPTAPFSPIIGDRSSTSALKTARCQRVRTQEVAGVHAAPAGPKRVPRKRLDDSITCSNRT